MWGGLVGGQVVIFVAEGLVDRGPPDVNFSLGANDGGCSKAHAKLQMQ